MAVLLGVLATGCTTSVDRESSNRGSGSTTELTTVENAFIVPTFEPGSCAIQIGDTAHMRFTVTNNRPAESERLLRITTEAADAVRITPNPTVQIDAKSSVAAGQPVEHPDDTAAPDEPITVVVEGLKDAARPGISVNVSFLFERLGKMNLRVPIEACPTQRR